MAPPAKPLAILGATSRLASDFVRIAATRGVKFALYARRPTAVGAFLAEHNLPADWNAGSLTDFGASTPDVGGVFNFVGVGDPAKAQGMGAAIFAATLESDRLALDHLARAPHVPYVFLSSGAVYGTGFDAPAGPDSVATVPVNRLRPQDWYTVAKLHAETVHRSCSGATIVDLRIFNYVSRDLDPAARFLISDMVRAVRDDTVFETTDTPLYRDFLHPPGSCDLLLACIAAPPGTNMPVDAYSKAPISKADLLALMTRDFGLRHRIVPAAATIEATGAKPYYYSDNRAAAALGYCPAYTSADAIRSEVAAMLEAKPNR